MVVEDDQGRLDRPWFASSSFKKLVLTTMEIKQNGLTDQEIFAELTTLAYDAKSFEQVVTLVWALPNHFWVRVAKRLIATCLMGVQPTFTKINKNEFAQTPTNTRTVSTDS